jgi:multiple sugar transport system ATP-binding protein
VSSSTAYFTDPRVAHPEGKPLDLYDMPVNKFVAGFIGSPAMNFIPATIGDDGKTLILDLSTVRGTLAFDDVTGVRV